MRSISKLIVFFIAFFAVFSFVGCDLSVVNSNTDDQIITNVKPTTHAPIVTTEEVEYYTVVWKDYDGTVLETDEEVASGVYPSYDGSVPTRNNGTFVGWTPEVINVEANAVYTAIYDVPYTINNEVILSDQNIVFTITRIEKDLFGTDIYLHFENKTSNKDLIYTWDNVGVNGFMVSAFFYEEVTAGNMANDVVTIYDLADLGISSIDELEFNLRVYDSNDWSADNLIDSVYQVYPTGLSVHEVVYPERKTTDDEIVLYDNEVGSFVILSYKMTIYDEIEIEYYIENKTDMDLMFTWDDVNVNGYMIDPFFATVVAEEKRKYGIISISSWPIEDYGFDKIDEIEFNLRAYNENDWLDDDVIDETYAIYPTGLTKETVVYPDRLSTSKEVVIVDNNQVSFVILSSYIYDYGDLVIKYYIENKTSDTELMFTWNDVTVNNYMIDPYFADSIIAGKREYGTITFYGSDLELNSITDINSIEFELDIYDYNDWLADSIVKSTFTYNPLV
jgi:hypothetical protein